VEARRRAEQDRLHVRPLEQLAPRGDRLAADVAGERLPCLPERIGDRDEPQARDARRDVLRMQPGNPPRTDERHGMVAHRRGA
jgi:hypothetical protein